MMNNPTNDIKLLNYQYPPEEYFEVLEQIEEHSGGCFKWAMWQAYTLGVMHGKRAERNKRK